MTRYRVEMLSPFTSAWTMLFTTDDEQVAIDYVSGSPAGQFRYVPYSF